MIQIFKSVLVLAVLVNLLACSKPSADRVEKHSNWLFGQWAIYALEGFDLAEACQRPFGQFGKQYLYWRGDVDGDPYEELNEVAGYVIDGNLIKAHLLQPTSYGAYVQKDGFMYFQKVSENVLKMVDWKYPRESPLLFRCPSSPIPYSADVAPTLPKYDNIEPGIVDRPRN